MTVIEKLEYLFNRVKEVNNEPRFNKGLTKEEIEGKLLKSNIPYCSELVDLYQLYNGVQYLNAFLSFCDLDYAIELYHYFKKLKEEYPEFQWKPSWFPILDLNGDIQILLDTNSKELASIDVESSSEEIIAQNYINYLDAFVELFKENSFIFCSTSDTCGYIELNEEAWLRIQSKYKIRSM